MDDADKGLQTFHGTPLALNVLERLKPQVGRIAINANRHIDVYESFGVSVWPDEIDNFPGPLGGFHAGLLRCETPYLLTTPCDTPLIPHDLVERLAESMHKHDAEIAMACSNEFDHLGKQMTRTHPVVCLMNVSIRDGLNSYMQSGGRKVSSWTSINRTVLVTFDAPHHANAFTNANTIEQLRSLEALHAG